MIRNILVTGSKGQLGSEIMYLSKKFPDLNFLFTDIDELDLSKSKKVPVPEKKQDQIKIDKSEAIPLPDKKIEKIVVKIGAAKDMLTTVANGNSLKAIKIATNAISPEVHLNACNPGLLVL